jgi:NAD(P)-dependent dehydrogenase (short-subunit alcohol dehydrogenase family)
VNTAQRPRTVVVTGGTSGVGRAVAQALAQRGDNIAILARGADGLRATHVELLELGAAGVVSVAADLADEDQVEAAAERIESELGPIDVWVNNAMATIFAEFLDIDPAEFRRATDVTYLGSVWGTRAALRRMVERDRGTIIQIGSALAHRGIPLQSPYCGAKHALHGFLDSVRTELLHRRSHVRISIVSLPAINTPQFDRGRSKMPRKPRPVAPIYQPDVAARAVLAAIDDPRREWLIGAPTVATVLAARHANALLDRYLARTGFNAQQTNEQAPPKHRDNLFEPVPGDPGAYGGFDSEASDGSLQAVISRRRGIVTACCVSAAVATLAGKRAAHRRRH